MQLSTCCCSAALTPVCLLAAHLVDELLEFGVVLNHREGHLQRRTMTIRVCLTHQPGRQCVASLTATALVQHVVNLLMGQ